LNSSAFQLKVTSFSARSGRIQSRPPCLFLARFVDGHDLYFLNFAAAEEILLLCPLLQQSPDRLGEIFGNRSDISDL